MAINFPDSPTQGQIFQNYVWDGEKWLGASTAAGAAVVGAVRYDLAQGLTVNQQAQARSNISVLKKNYVINGAMMVSQENGATANNTNNYYPVDMFVHVLNLSGGVAGTAQVFGSTPSGSPNRLHITASTAQASIGAGNYLFSSHSIEGLRAADLKFGSTSAKTITIQFGVKAPAGTYCVAVSNGNSTRSYVAEYVITAGEAGTDVIKSVTIPGDQAGTWASDNTVGINIKWILAAGTTYHTTAGSWVGVNALATANQFNFMGTINNVFQLFDVSLTEGTSAPPFQVPDFAAELAACMRYYEKSFLLTTLPAQNAGLSGAHCFAQGIGASLNQISPPIFFAVPKRIPSSTITFYHPAAASAQVYNGTTGASWSSTILYVISEKAVVVQATTAAGSAIGNAALVHWTANARL